MIGVYLRRADEIEAARAVAADLIQSDRDESLRFFSSDSSLICFPFRPHDVGHLLWPTRESLFERIVVDRTLQLFDSPWSRAFLAQLHRSLAPGGVLTVPHASLRQAQLKGHLALPALESFFGRSGKTTRQDQYVEFERSEALPQVSSVLRWYFHDCAQVAVDDLVLRPVVSEARPEDVRRHLGEMASPQPWMQQLAIRGEGPQNASDVGKKHCYWLWGLAAKAAILAEIIRDHSDGRTDCSYLDHGGGLGLLAAEMILDPQTPVDHAVNCDLDPINLLLSIHLFEFFKSRLAGRLFAHLGTAESFEYDRPYDVISFVGSLLYVPKSQTEGALQRAWEALRPGGILVVHENLRAESYLGTREYDLMFTRRELEALLGQFGSIKYYASTAVVRLDADQVGEKTVFRVVHKP